MIRVAAIPARILLLAQPDQPTSIEVFYFGVGLLMVAVGLLALTVGRA